MTASNLHYFPLAWPYLLLLAALTVIVAAAVAVRLLTFASATLGIGPRAMAAVLLLSLLGSYVNIPIAQLPERHVWAGTVVSYFGIDYVVPVLREWPGTVIAINVGGAVVPVVLSLYLMARNGLYGLSAASVAIVALVCHLLARPVPGLGIALPIFVPPLVTAVTALVLSRRHAAPLAYIGGSIGTLLGADVLNLDKVQGLGAPVVSIGGAGTFDGIFVTSLLAVLYAGIATRRVLR